MTGFALPAWGDAQWLGPQYYTTIQTGDIDGDGDGELLGRAVDGVHAYDFRGDLGQWLPLYPGGGLFSDAQGWGQPRFYSTIQTADLDGDGRAELLGRGAGGVVAFSLDVITNTWTPLPPVPDFSDAEGWGQPRFYSTIQAADLDGDGRAELLGRGAGGVLAFSFDAVANAWTPLPPVPDFGDVEGWGQPRFYSTIQTADLDGDGRAEVLGRGAGGILAFSFDAVANAWTPFPPVPDFGDVEGWGQPQYYETIQTADLDGDGRAEVLGRGVGGILAYAFDPATGWSALPSLSADFTDAGGWNRPEYYSTLRTGDIDGDGRDEAVGRGTAGIHAWSLHPSTRKWVPLMLGGPFPDASGWALPRSYATVQLADVDGFAPLGTSGSKTAARLELIGRGPTGIQTFRWNTRTNGWEAPSAPFPDYSNGATAKAYGAINAALGGSLDPSFDVRAQYPAAAQDQLAIWKEEVVAMTRPRNVSRAAWQRVQTQISIELEYAQLVQDWFDDYQAGLIADLYLLESMDDTAEILQFDTSQATQLEAAIINVFAGIVRGVGALGGPAGSLAGGLLAAGISAGASVATNEEFSHFEGSYLQLRAELEGAFQDADTGNEISKQEIMGDYGLLAAVGELIDAAVWTRLDADQREMAVAAALHGYSTWIWQTITPGIWGSFPCGFGFSDCDFNAPDGTDWMLVISDEVFTTRVPLALRLQLFEPTSADCQTTWDPATCNLGVPRGDVFMSRNGWFIPCLDDKDVCRSLTEM